MKNFIKNNKFNWVLTLLFVGGVVFSFITIVSATAPNPGHNFTESSGGIATGGIPYGSSTDTFSQLADVTTGNALISGGAGAIPSYGKITEAHMNLTDLTTGNVSITAHGFTPKAPNNTTTFLRGDGTWAAPAGGGGGTPGGADTQIQYNNATAFGGSANLTWNNTTNTFGLKGTDAEILLNGITTEPSAPPAGDLYIYSKSISGRMMPKWKAPSGVDTSFQSNLGFNTIQLWTPSLTNIGAGFGTVWPAGTGTFTSPLPTAGTALQLRRSMFANIVTTTNQILGITASTAAQIPSFWRGNTAGNGGFFMQTRFTIELVPATTVRLFVGLTSLTTGVAAADTVSTNTAGLSHITTDGLTTMAFMTNNGTTTTRATFTVPTIASKNAYDFTMYAKPNDTVIYYRLVDLLTGLTIVDSSTSTTLPTNTVFMGPQVQMSNGTANVTVNTTAIGINKIYIESDN